jgi:hypothetical protein
MNAQQRRRVVVETLESRLARSNVDRTRLKSSDLSGRAMHAG